MSFDLWRGGALKLGSSTFIGLKSQRVALNNSVGSQAQSGEIHRGSVFLRRQKPNLDLVTLDVEAMFDALTALGPSGAENLGLNFGSANALLYRAKDDGVSRASGSVHTTLGIVDGILVPMSLECETDSDFELSLQGQIVHDGTDNDSIIVTPSVALPTFPNDDIRFGMGPITIESILLEGVRRVSLQFNSTLQGEAGDGTIWDTVACLRSQEPVLMIEGMNPDWFQDAVIPQLGRAATHANSEFYCRKRIAGGDGYVADGTAEHIKVQVAGIAVIDDGFNFDGTDKAGASIAVHLRRDGATAALPLIVTTSSAIT